jgi:hypothetical protein
VLNSVSLDRKSLGKLGFSELRKMRLHSPVLFHKFSVSEEL